MADEKPSGGGPMEMVFILAAIIGGLTVLWFMNGGPSRADLRGIFLNPPAPLGPGNAYGPTPTLQKNTGSNTGANTNPQ